MNAHLDVHLDTPGFPLEKRRVANNTILVLLVRDPFAKYTHLFASGKLADKLAKEFVEVIPRGPNRCFYVSGLLGYGRLIAKCMPADTTFSISWWDDNKEVEDWTEVESEVWPSAEDEQQYWDDQAAEAEFWESLMNTEEELE